MSFVSEVYLNNIEFLKRFLRKYLKSEQTVEDIVQEVYIKALNAEKQKPIDYPKAFLFTIAKNLALNEINRKISQRTVYLEDCAPETAETVSTSLEDDLDAKNSVNVYLKAVADLPERSRNVFLLRKIHGLKHQTIADDLQISVSSVEKHLKTATLSCRAYLKRHDINLTGISSIPKKSIAKIG